jgi:NADH:ubiquinone oxidoreductase subunit 4 (subunit M)
LAPLQHIWLVTNWQKVALFFSLASLGCAIVLLNQFNAGENISVHPQWINQPNISFALQADGLSIAISTNISINSLSLYFLRLRMYIQMPKRFMR